MEQQDAVHAEKCVVDRELERCTIKTTCLFYTVKSFVFVVDKKHFLDIKRHRNSNHLKLQSSTPGTQTSLSFIHLSSWCWNRFSELMHLHRTSIDWNRFPKLHCPDVPNQTMREVSSVEMRQQFKKQRNTREICRTTSQHEESSCNICFQIETIDAWLHVQKFKIIKLTEYDETCVTKKKLGETPSAHHRGQRFEKPAQKKTAKRTYK